MPNIYLCKAKYQTSAEAQWRQHAWSWHLGAVVELLPKLLRFPTPLFSLQQHVLSNILYQPNFLSLPFGHLVFSCLGEKQKLIYFINYPYFGFKKYIFESLSTSESQENDLQNNCVTIASITSQLIRVARHITQ